jgi:phage shock protein PspC (stress-responsive transcriptional regulator)
MSTSPPTGAPDDPPGAPRSTPTGAGPQPGHTSRLPAPLTRGRDGRWLAGVCTGLARQRKLPVGSVRIAFALAALVGGVGVLAYLACWLIIPAEGDLDDGAAGIRGIVVLAQACAAGVGLATLAVLGGGGAIFGFGWVVLVIAAVVLVGALVSWPRLGAGWALLPVAALVLPALAMTLGGVHVDPETHDVASAPRAAADLPRTAYKSGLGSLFVDLRNTEFPANGSLSLQIDAGVRRTIVALPASRCVYVDVHYDIVPFAARLASILTGRDEPFSGVTLFGDIQASGGGESGNLPASPSGRALRSPVLNIDFHSAGGSLYVRDYPDDVDPQSEPDWPGYPVFLEPRPDEDVTRQMIDAWLLRRRVQSASVAALTRLLPGPCGATGQLPVVAQASGPEAAGLPPTEPASGVLQAGSAGPAAPEAPAAPAAPGLQASGGGTRPLRVAPTTAKAVRSETARSKGGSKVAASNATSKAAPSKDAASKAATPKAATPKAAASGVGRSQAGPSDASGSRG